MRVDMILTRGKVGVPGRSYLLLLHNSDEDACVRTASAPHSNSTLATVPRTPSAAMIIPPRVSLARAPIATEAIASAYCSGVLGPTPRDAYVTRTTFPRDV